jgi:hypothetical protein
MERDLPFLTYDGGAEIAIGDESPGISDCSRQLALRIAAEHTGQPMN